jgi:hypothetical protein
MALMVAASAVIPPGCGHLSAAACLRPPPVHDPAIGRRMIVGVERPANEAADASVSAPPACWMRPEITPGRVTPTRDRSEQNLKATSN